MGDGRVAVHTNSRSIDAGLSILDVRIACAVSVIAAHGRLIVHIAAVDAERVRLVEDVQGRKVLPDETLLVRRTRRDVGGEQSPAPRLRDAHLEPDGHGEETFELAKDHLLPGLGGDALQKQSARCARIEVLEEAVDARLAPARELLVEVDVLPQVFDGVVVRALDGGVVAQQVRQERSMADLLFGHELKQISVLGREAHLFKFFNGKGGKAPVEEVELDPFLVEGEGDGLVVKVALHSVHGGRAVGVPSAGGSVRRRLLAVELAVGWVLVGVGSGWERGDGCSGHVG